MGITPAVGNETGQLIRMQAVRVTCSCSALDLRLFYV